MPAQHVLSYRQYMNHDGLEQDPDLDSSLKKMDPDSNFTKKPDPNPKLFLVILQLFDVSSPPLRFQVSKERTKSLLIFAQIRTFCVTK